MVHTRNACICFAITLVAFYSCICFTAIPVTAQINIETSPYKPDIIYLGRETYKEFSGIPTDLEDPGPQYIYALVRDAYNQNLHGKLLYTTFSNIDNKKILSGTSIMMLINGIPTNGTWRGEIPKPRVNVPYTVLYNATFKDDLNYSVTKSGPYYNPKDYTGNNYSFASGYGYNVTNRYIKATWYQGIFRNTMSFVAMISDNLANMPYEVTLHYKLNNDTMWHYKTMNPLTNYSMQPYPGVIHRYYSTSLTIPPHGGRVTQFYSTLLDREGNIYPTTPTPTPTPTPPEIDTISVKTDITKVDVDNEKLGIGTTFDGTLISDTTIPSVQRYNLRDQENVNLQLIDHNNNNKTLVIPGSLHDIHAIYPEKLLSFHAKTGNASLALVGTASLFPYDHYRADFTIKIPLEVRNITYYLPRFVIPYVNTWEAPALNPIPKYTWDPQTGFSSSERVHMDFKRNDFSYTAEYTVFPMLFAFFLLGTISFLEPKGEYLVARIALTIGILAFVFAFVSVLTDMKPQYIKSLKISTFADFLLRLVLVAAVAFTISSVIGYRIVTMERQV